MSEETLKVGAVELPEIVSGAQDLLTSKSVGGQYGLSVIRKPDAEEWVTLNMPAVITPLLYKHRVPRTEFDTEFYYFAPGVQEPAAARLRQFVVVPYYSWDRERHDLFVTGLSARGKSRWTDSMRVLLTKPAAWHLEHQVCITAADGFWDIRELDIDPANLPAWPAETTGRLLADALGGKRYVQTPDHPIFAAINRGRPVK